MTKQQYIYLTRKVVTLVHVHSNLFESNSFKVDQFRVSASSCEFKLKCQVSGVTTSEHMTLDEVISVLEGNGVKIFEDDQG